MNKTTPSSPGNVITIDEERIKSHLDRVLRGSVEETLNVLLDAEADRLCNAHHYERSEPRQDTRARHDERNLQTAIGHLLPAEVEFRSVFASPEHDDQGKFRGYASS